MINTISFDKIRKQAGLKFEDHGKWKQTNTTFLQNDKNTRKYVFNGKTFYLQEDRIKEFISNFKLPVPKNVNGFINEFTDKRITNVFEKVSEILSSQAIEGINTTRNSYIESKKIIDEIESMNLTIEEKNRLILEKGGQFYKESYDTDRVSMAYGVNTAVKVKPYTFANTLGITNAYRLLQNRKDETLSMSFIKDLYNALTLNNETLDLNSRLKKELDFRHDDVYIGSSMDFSKNDKGIPAEEIKLAMYELYEFANKESDDFIENTIQAAILHFVFVWIHPYFDGNGRMARLLMTKKLKMSINTNQLILLTHSAYYDAIVATRKTNDLTYFVTYIMFIHYIDLWLNFLVYNKKDSEPIEDLEKDILLIFALKQNEALTSRDVLNYLSYKREISRIQRKLKDLVDKKVIKITKTLGKKQFYILNIEV